MEKLTITIPIPKLIENIILYFLLRHRKKHHGYPFRRIKLTKGKFAKVDPQDYKYLVWFPWQLVKCECEIYCAGCIENRQITYMHRVIMNAPKGKIVDHKNSDGLDNTKANLRFAPRSQNACNRKPRKGGSSRYKGVYYCKKEQKWRAAITCNRVRRLLGSFGNEQDAARAYDEAAKKYHGEFATLNFPNSPAGRGAK